jgi:cytoskeleton protein RodZ
VAASTRPPRPRGDDSPERWDERFSPSVRDDRPPRTPGPRPRAGPGAADAAPAGRSATLATPGERLRAARLRRKISLTEAEQATRIRARYLQAIEEDEYGALPSSVYSRGFLRNYAIYLGVPPDEVMAAVPERRRRERRPDPPVRRVAPPIKLSTPRSLWLIAAAAGGVLVLVALIWLGLSAPDPRGSGGATAGSADAPQAGAAAGPAGAGALLPPLATGAATVAPTQAPTAVPTTTPAAGVNVELRTVDRAWIRVTVDGRVVDEETYAAGQSLRWTGQQSVLLRVGNGAGVDVTVNGQRLGALGQAGQIIEREFRRDAATPTAAAAPATR